MATTTIPTANYEGRQLSSGKLAARPGLHPADINDDQRLIGQTAEEFVVKEVLAARKRARRKKARADGGIGEESRRTGPARRRRAGRIWRRGARQDFDYRADREDFRLRRICRDARRTGGDRHAADRLFRNGRAEEKISAEARQRRMARGLLPFGAPSRLRCAECTDARGAFAGRPALDPERPEDVDHQRRLRGCLHRVRKSERREIFGVHRRARLSLDSRPATKSTRWGFTAARRPRSSWRIAGFPRKTCCTKSGADTSWRSIF